MALLSVIRRWHFRDQLSIREISRRTGLSRNTVRKYLRDDTVEPAFKAPERPSKLDAFADKLSAWLRAEAAKSRKQKRTVKQLHADLVSLGYDGSYGRVAASFNLCGCSILCGNDRGPHSRHFPVAEGVSASPGGGGETSRDFLQRDSPNMMILKEVP